ncbi:cytochrome B561 [Hylemonella gracilis ATCC 19624]|uniref:Cytochrome B561 n=1 Tax=Hylemonella gracilis ATCC 19624 TaxID=887062 RepID=F3KQN2_9BURK|nr:cytochrome B561 [Hylemonella gracilis ATCC 19624]
MSAGAFLHQKTSELKHRVRVWDLPTRLFHWLLAAAIIGMFATAYLGALDWHMRLGCAVLVLLLFRLVWGLVGGHWSRFANFAPSPRRIWRALRGQARDTEAGLGHTLLGALSVWAMLLVLLAQVISGLMSDDDIAYAGPWARHFPETFTAWMSDYHADIGQWLLLGLVLVHVGAILFYLLVRGDNLISPMVHGDKLPTLTSSPCPPSRDDLLSRVLALVLLLACAVLTWWLTGFAA